MPQTQTPQETPQNFLRYFLPTDTRKKTDDGKHQFTISDATADRYGTVIPISAWDLSNYEKNGIVAYQHETSSWVKNDPDYIIGKGRVWIEDDTLIGEVDYEPLELNPLADKIRRKVEFGTLSATSVGFSAHGGHMGKEERGEDPSLYYFDRVELLEFSIVNIPANPNAVKRNFEEYIENQKRLTQPSSIHPEAQPNPALIRARNWLFLHKLNH